MSSLKFRILAFEAARVTTSALVTLALGFCAPAHTAAANRTPVRAAQAGGARPGQPAGRQAAPAATARAARYSHDAAGLQRELQPFLDTYAAAIPGLGQTMSVFVIPNGEAWFAARFPKELAAQLSADQKAAVANYESALIGNIGKWPQKTRFQVACLPREVANAPLQERAGKALPTGDVAVESFQCTFAANADSAQEQRNFVNLANFVYVDGAYRFVGIGFYPFWATAKQ